MTKLPFSRLLLSAALASTVGLTGCDISDKDETPVAGIVYGTDAGGPGCDLATLAGDCAIITTNPDANGDEISDYYIPGTFPRWNPAASDIPLATDILFSGSTDGTAFVSMVADPTNPVYSAINDLDGWSTSAGIDVALSGSINPATVISNPLSPGQNVFLLPIEALEGADPLDPAGIDTAAPFDSATVAATAYSAQVASADGGSNNLLRINPTRPLLPGKKYLVVVTNGVENAAGDPITRSANFDLLGSTAPLANAALQPLRDAVGGWEQLAVGYMQARNTYLNTTYALSLPTDAAALKSSVAIAFTLTTTDPVKPLVAMGSARAAWFSNLAPTLGGATAIATVNNLDAAGLLPAPKARTVTFPTASGSNSFDLNLFSGSLAASKATLYTGAITLPYYQTVGTSSDFTFLGKFWSANTSLIGALGITVPSDIPDGSGADITTNMTYRFPFPQRTANVTIPIQTTLPTSATCAGGYPNDGFPVVIYVHGITSDRTSVIALAHSLASNACVATVAIDLPMHGVPANSSLYHYLNVEHADLTTVAGDVAANERHFDVVAGATGLPQAMNFASPNASIDGSGSWFINLANLQNTRDNVRQAVMDLLNLNASLASIDSDGDGHADFDTSKVSVVGVSLGGIVATTFTTVNQLSIANDTLANTAAGSPVFPIRLNSVKRLAASVASGELAGILENSLSFGPRIMAGLYLKGVTPGTSNYQKFLYVAQSTVDSGDPVNFATTLVGPELTLAGLNVPVLMQEIVGGGSAAAFGDSKTYVADKVVPNNATSGTTINYGYGTFTTIPSPLTGTDPLATLLGAAGPVFGPSNNASTTPLRTKITVGHHASLLRPNEDALSSPVVGEYIATVEMQTQVVSFVANPAAVAVGTVGTSLGLPAYTSCSYVVGCVTPAPP